MKSELNSEKYKHRESSLEQDFSRKTRKSEKQCLTLIHIRPGAVVKSAQILSKIRYSNELSNRMKKEKFVYNRHTLRYEKIELSLGQKLWRVSAAFAALGLYTFSVWAMIPHQPTEEQARENAELKKQLFAVNEQVGSMGKVLENLKERDNYLYRTVLQMNPLDEKNWSKSTPEVDLASLSDEELANHIQQKLNKTKMQMAVLAKSQDEVLGQSKVTEAERNARPMIRPIQSMERAMHQLSGFGTRLHPILKTPHMHTGIDFGAPMNTPIHATGDGKVVRVEFKESGYGRNVVIDHGYGFQTLYAHMNKVDVKVGQQVKRGEIIGRVGSTGMSTSPHVHYEVFKNGERVDPAPYCMDMSPQDYKVFAQRVSAMNAFSHK